MSFETKGKILLLLIYADFIYIASTQTHFICLFSDRLLLCDRRPWKFVCETFVAAPLQNYIYRVIPGYRSPIKLSSNVSCFVRQLPTDVVDFRRRWAEYKAGFGAPNGSYWLGNDRLHALTGKVSFFGRNPLIWLSSQTDARNWLMILLEAYFTRRSAPCSLYLFCFITFRCFGMRKKFLVSFGAAMVRWSGPLFQTRLVYLNIDSRQRHSAAHQAGVAVPGEQSQLRQERVPALRLRSGEGNRELCNCTF